MNKWVKENEVQGHVLECLFNLLSTPLSLVIEV